MTLAEFLSRHKIDGASFARTIGVTRAALNFWLAGSRIPRPEQMQKIIAATDGNVTPNDFLPPPSADAAAQAKVAAE